MFYSRWNDEDQQAMDVGNCFKEITVTAQDIILSNLRHLGKDHSEGAVPP